MHPDLKQFAITWLRVAAAALVPVVLTAFLSIPQALGRFPGDPVTTVAGAPVERHMT